MLKCVCERETERERERWRTCDESKPAFDASMRGINSSDFANLFMAYWSNPVCFLP